MSLDTVLEFAASQGKSLVPESLLPAGFRCWPAEQRAIRLARVLEHTEEHDTIALAEVAVKEFERRGPRGQLETVRQHTEMRAGGAAGAAGAAGRAAWEAGRENWPHPPAVGGHKVLGVYTHPATNRAMYDLGHGLHAEGKPGGKPGAVMRSNTGLNKAELAEKGWSYAKPPKEAAAGAAKTSTTSQPGGKGLPAQKFEHHQVPGGLAGRTTGAAGSSSALGKVEQAAGKGKPSPLERGPRAGKAAKKVQAGLAEQQRAYMESHGFKIDPKDWNQDWVPPHEDRISPDMHPSGDIKDLSKPGRVGAEGTAADPIDVKGDVKEALRQLAQGKHVRLNKVPEVTLLMQEIARHAAETEASGKDEKPDWDFGRLSVKGTNLFAAQNKGIRRINMPQFSGLATPGSHAAQVAGGAGKFADLTDEFEQHLKDKGIKVTRETMPASHLKATQSELVGAKVAGFANAYLHGNPKAVKAMSEPIMVTKDGYVIDGHHRWGANMLVDAVDGKLDNDAPMNVRKVDMEIGAMIPYANHWAAMNGIASAAASAGDTGAALKK